MSFEFSRTIRIGLVAAFGAGFAAPALAQDTMMMEMTADGSSTNMTTTTQGNTQALTIEASEPLRRSELKTVPDAVAPSIVGGNPCVVGASVGVSGLGFGVSGGLGVQDPECEMRQQVALLANIGMQEAAIARFCMDRRVAEAFRMSGRPCPQDAAAARAAARPAPAPAAAPVVAATPAAQPTPAALAVETAAVTRSSTIDLPARPVAAIETAAVAENCDNYARLRRSGISFGEWSPACQARHRAEVASR
jgi:hypothetical protein